MRKILAVLFMGIMMAFAFTACNDDDNTAASGQNESTDMIEVVFSVDYPDESGITDIDDQVIQVPAGSSVLDATTLTVEVISEDSSDGSKYITSIGGLAATDSSGWVYEVNDKAIMESANVHKLSKGDELSWEYTSWEDMDN
ncbi:MAG: DUF4430 domain-containing protein [Clostridiales bacterium]|nr:DUF4430 domain-containing protein [Clostridiales bacterium]